MDEHNEQHGRTWPNGGIHPPELGPSLTPYLSQSITVYDRTGAVRAHLGPPRGLLGQGSHFLEIGQHCHPDDRPRLTEITAAVIDSDPGWCGGGVLRFQRGDGTWGAYEIQAWNLVGEDPLDGILVRMAEVTAVDASGLVGPVARLAPDLDVSLAAAAGTAALTLDRHGVIRHVTPAAEAIVGRADDDLYGKDVTAVVHPTDRAILRGHISTMLPRAERTVICRLVGVDGAPIPAELRLVGGSRDPLSLITVVVTDRRDEPELLRLATTDPLTGLANRLRLFEAVTGLLASGRPVSLLFADVDGLKRTNDQLGHAVGDRLIVEVADLLRSVVSAGDTAGRLGGDEFVVVGPGDDPHRMEEIAERLRRAVQIVVGGEQTTISVGLAHSRAGDTPDSLIARADAAMFVDKRQGRRSVRRSERPPR